MRNKKIKNICSIGAVYEGGPTLEVTAKHCPNIQIKVTDHNLEIIENYRGKNLLLFNEAEKHISMVTISLISLNTPTKTKVIGAG